jgi:ubiquitin carboxyl-terminal hydrolase 9/24
MRILVFLAHFTLQDGPCPAFMTPVIPTTDPSLTVSDHILMALLALLRKEVSEHGRHIAQYFHLFLSYSNFGIAEKQQLLNLNVLSLFMLVSLDDGTVPPIKYQYAELSKLYAVVSQLVRCCDVSSACHSSVASRPILPNPHGDPALKQPPMKLPVQAHEILFEKPGYVKKLIQDCNNYEETTKLLKFCCWENPHFSSTVLSELLWQVAYSCTYELRPYLDLLLQMLLLDDSWQNHRIHNALKGIPEDRDGLFDTIQLSKNQYQKRAYQCIKMMVSLFTICSAATEMLMTNMEVKRRWSAAVDWLQDELERRPYSGNAQYTYNNWSTQTQSNETSNGYFLERTQSARGTLAKALDLCPDEEADDNEVVMDDSGGVSSTAAASAGQQQPQPAVASSASLVGGPQSPSSAVEHIHPTTTGPQVPNGSGSTVSSPVQDTEPAVPDQIRPSPIGGRSPPFQSVLTDAELDSVRSEEQINVE